MKVLIDTNVILDIVFNREGCEAARSVFQKLESEDGHAYISVSMVTDLFYIIRKELHDVKKTYQVLENIFKLVCLLAVTEQDIEEAFAEEWKDFEDCVQFIVAKNNKIDCVITGNKKDFANASIPVMSPQEYLQS